MASRADVRRIALSLPATREAEGRFAFSVLDREKYKGYAWVWMEHVDPRKARVPCPAVLAVRVANLDAKEMLLLADPVKFFTEPHYNGFPAILVRLAEVGRSELRALLVDAWTAQAPKALIAQFTGKSGSTRKKARQAP